MENDELKKKENEPQKIDNKNQNNKTVIIIVISLMIAMIVGVIVYFAFIKKDDNSNNGNQGNNGGQINEETMKYTSDDGKVIELKEIDSDYSHFVRRNTYQIKVNDKTYTAYGDYSYSDNHLIVYTDNNFYLLEKSSKKILAYYESKDRIAYERLMYDGSSDDNMIQWYNVFSNSVSTYCVMIANTKSGKAFEFSDNKERAFMAYNDKIYFTEKNKIEQYDTTGKLLSTKTYDEIIDSSANIGRKGTDLYNIDLKDFSEEKAKKIEFSDDKNKLNIYEMTYENSDGIGHLYYLSYNKKYYNSDLNYEEFNSKDTYFTVGVFTGGIGNDMDFLLNRENNKLVKSSKGVNYIKAKNGYYFTDLAHAGECATECGPTTVYTTSWKELGTLMGWDNITDNESNIYINVDNVIVKFDLNGNELSRSTEFKNVGNGIVYNNVLYAVIDESDNYHYLFNYSDNSKIKLGKVSDNVDYPWLATDIEKDDNRKLRIHTTSGNYSFDPTSKKIEELKDEE